jgi:hypothetical protein
MDTQTVTQVVEKALHRLLDRLAKPDLTIPEEHRGAWLEHELSEELRSVLAAQPEFSKPRMINSASSPPRDEAVLRYASSRTRPIRIRRVYLANGETAEKRQGPFG